MLAMLSTSTKGCALNKEEDVGREELRKKRSWERMKLIPVGNLGAVIQDKTGSFLDSGKGSAMKDMA
jgi:hypothetical protein